MLRPSSWRDIERLPSKPFSIIAVAVVDCIQQGPGFVIRKPRRMAELLEIVLEFIVLCSAVS